MNVKQVLRGSVVATRKVETEEAHLQGLDAGHPIPGLVLQHGAYQLLKLVHALGLPGGEDAVKIDALPH